MERLVEQGQIVKKTARRMRGVKENVLLVRFYRKIDHFTKTGSGQTQGKLKKTCVVLSRTFQQPQQQERL